MTIHHSGSLERQAKMSVFFEDPPKGEHIAIPSDPAKDPDPEPAIDLKAGPRSNRVSVPEIARRLNVGRLAVYSMLEQGIMPGIRLGRRWIITRHAYDQWERTCGMRDGAGLQRRTEVTVLN
jgi:excisionase family DNA binding protein